LSSSKESNVNRRSFLVMLTAAAAARPILAATGTATLPPVEVFKSPYCGCCGAWVEHMKAAGFSVKVTEVQDTNASRRRVGLPNQYASCHTAVVAGYVLEGHVPAQDVKRLLAQKPAAIGLAVPGMPQGSPGMEAGGKKDAYKVLLVDKAGRSSVYASYPKA
jgi:hypothetical protein